MKEKEKLIIEAAIKLFARKGTNLHRFRKSPMNAKSQKALFIFTFLPKKHCFYPC
ncbi:hypothetical protein B938_15430 [Bacillus velezensis AS43.3]|nr:hypothetical protein B938_15430 [Bacillus velezensis AS43.3]